MFEVARFQAEPEAVTRCRHWLVGCLAEQVDERRLQDAALCVSELAANAIRHARSPFIVELESFDGWVRVSVHDDDLDGSARSPAAGRPDVTQPTGRGLFIVDSVARQWGSFSYPDDGKDIWFEV